MKADPIPPDDPAADCVAVSDWGPDGRERVMVAMILAADLTDEERALTIEEALSVAKALLCPDTIH